MRPNPNPQPPVTTPTTPDLTAERKRKRWAHFHVWISFVTAIVMLYRSLTLPSLDDSDWPIAASLFLLPGSFLFYIPWVPRQGLLRLTHWLFLSSMLIPDLVRYLFGSQSHFLPNGFTWHLAIYAFAAAYYLIFVLGKFWDLLDEFIE
jgi:hypothetical protein